MNKTDLLEIRKRFKKEGNSLSRMGCFILSSEEEQIRESKVTQFLLLEDKEQHKYLEIASRALAAGKGTLTQDADADPELTRLLAGIISSRMENTELMEVLAQEIRNHYTMQGNYALIIFLDDYDVPVKTSDKRSLDESEEVYSYMLCCICPIRPSAVGLGYYPGEQDMVRCMDIVQALQKPAAAFVYPSFEDRSTDIDHIFCNAREKEGQALMVDLFGCEPYVEEKKPPKPATAAMAPEVSTAAQMTQAGSDELQTTPENVVLEDSQVPWDEEDAQAGNTQGSGMQAVADPADTAAETQQANPVHSTGYVPDPEDLTKPSDLKDSETDEETDGGLPQAGEVIPVGMKQFEIKNIDGKDCFVIPTGFVNIEDIIRLLREGK